MKDSSQISRKTAARQQQWRRRRRLPAAAATRGGPLSKAARRRRSEGMQLQLVATAAVTQYQHPQQHHCLRIRRPLSITVCHSCFLVPALPLLPLLLHVVLSDVQSQMHISTIARAGKQKSLSSPPCPSWLRAWDYSCPATLPASITTTAVRDAAAGGWGSQSSIPPS